MKFVYQPASLFETGSLLRVLGHAVEGHDTRVMVRVTLTLTVMVRIRVAVRVRVTVRCFVVPGRHKLVLYGSVAEGG